jgi:hypothetical protein
MRKISAGEKQSALADGWTVKPLVGLLFRMALLVCLAVPACRPPAPAPLTAADRDALRPGDLLFQDTDGSPLCDAIRAVTEGCDGGDFTHVGIVAATEPRVEILEAGGGGVKITPLEKFLARSTDDRGRPRVVVGRLKEEFRPAAEPAILRAKALIGAPYDDVFTLGDEKYYCSELVYVSYLDPAGGEPLFEVFPMTFCAPGSDRPMPVWQEYYARKGVAIPEGKPGCNPGGLSRSDKLTIVHAFGKPTGWTEETYLRHAGGK